jgi:peptide/nickel transport system permease protein
MATSISITIGVILGAVAGYFRGLIDDLIIWLYTTFQSIPGILLIIAFAVVLKNVRLFGMELSGLPTVYIALGMTDWVGICRLIRGETLKHREQEYVQAARAYGMGHARIIFRHILPNISHLVIITFSLGFVSAIHTEVILTYLGLGAKDKTWGTMINNATQVLSKGIWWEMAAATAAIFVVSLALNIWGDALRDALDPKLKT